LLSIKDQKSTENQTEQNQNEIKRSSLLRLKETIDHNKEIFQAKVLKKKHLEGLKKKDLEQQTQEIIKRGENPNFYLTRQAKITELENKKKYKNFLFVVCLLNAVAK
jgi:hypothetical protein